MTIDLTKSESVLNHKVMSLSQSDDCHSANQWIPIGQTKEEWLLRLNRAIDDSKCNLHIRQLMQTLITCDVVIPRDRHSLELVVRNRLRVTNQYYFIQLWKILNHSIDSNLDIDSDNHLVGYPLKPKRKVDSKRVEIQKPFDSIDKKSKVCKKLKQNRDLKQNVVKPEINFETNIEITTKRQMIGLIMKRKEYKQKSDK